MTKIDLRNQTKLGPGDEGWDNGDPPSEEGRVRRRKNLRMLQTWGPGLRTFKVVRTVRVKDKLVPRDFWVKAVDGPSAKRYVREQIGEIEPMFEDK